MLPNPLYRGGGDLDGSGGRRQRNEFIPTSNEPQSDNEGTRTIQELRGFKTYLKRRLKEILKTNRSLELYEQVDQINFYLDVMSDSNSDSIHGVDGLKGFINKLHEMQRKNPLTAPGNSNSDDEASVTSGCDHKSEVTESWDDFNNEYVEVAKLRSRGKSYHDWRIGEILKRADEDDDKLPDWWRLPDKMENNNNCRNTTSREQQPASFYDEISFLRDNQPKPDIISIAGIEDLVERRQKKASILKNPIPQQAGSVLQEKPVHHHQDNCMYSPPSSHQAKKPHWFFDDPELKPTSYRDNNSNTTTSYDASRMLQQNFGNAVPRQPIITSTFVPGYGQVNITTPLQSVVNTAPPHPFPYQQYEYQVPRELHPNPCYDAVHQPQPQSSVNYAFVQSSSRGFKRSRGAQRGGMHRQRQAQRSEDVAHSLIPAPGTSTQRREESNNNDCIPEDEYGEYDTSSSVCSFSSVSTRDSQHQRNNQFQTTFRSVSSGDDRPRNFNNKNESFQKPLKRVTIAEPDKFRLKPIPKKTQSKTKLSEVRKKIELDWNGMFKLGGKKGKPEKVPDPEPEEVFESPPPSPEPEKEESMIELVKKLLESNVTKKERTRLLEDDEALKKYINKIKKDRANAKKTKKDVSCGKKVTTTRAKKVQSKTKQTKKAFQEESDESINKCSSNSSSESETASVISNSSGSRVSTTRSATRTRRNQNGKNSPDKNKPGPSSVPSNKAKKSTGKQKANTMKQSSPRKRPASLVINNNEDESEEQMQSPPTRVDPKSNTDKNHEKKQVENMKKTIQQTVDELRMEYLQKKKKSKMCHFADQDEIDPMELSMRTFRSRTNEKGGQIIGNNSTLVNTYLGKINLGTEDKSGLAFVKQEVKQEVEDMLHDEEYDDNAHLLSMVEVKMDLPTDDDNEMVNNELNSDIFAENDEGIEQRESNIGGNNAEGQEASIESNEKEEMQAETNIEEKNPDDDNDDHFNPGWIISSVQGNFVVSADDTETFSSATDTSKVNVNDDKNHDCLEVHVTEEVEINE